MAFTTNDLVRFLGDLPAIQSIVPSFPLTGGVSTLFTFPANTFGQGKNYIECIVADSFSAGATTATVNFGSSTSANQGDFNTGASLNPASLQPICIWPPNTNITYVPGTIMQANVTGAGSGTCRLVIFGGVS
jgi:hypothetical protein